LGPPSSPLARFELRSAVRSSDIWVERGGASTDTFYLPCSSTPLQSITAATSHRVLCRSCSRPVYARGRTPDEDRGRLRIRFRGVTRGWVPILRACSRASSRGGPEGATGSFGAFHSCYGPVLGLGPMSSHLTVGDGRASGVELRHRAGKPVRGRVLWVTVTACAAARLPEPFETSSRSPAGRATHRKRRAAEQASHRRVEPEGCLTRGAHRGGSRSARHAAGTR
jgi:hypothetical protein